MRKPKVIGFLAKAGNGKSTASTYLREKYGAKIIGFAHPLKQMAKDIMSFSQEQVFGEASIKEVVDDRWNMSPRTFLQKLGQAGRDHLGDDIWANACLNTIIKEHAQIESDENSGYPGLWVIEDVRYPNEAASIVDNPHINGKIARLIYTKAKSSADPNHPSEYSVDLVPSTNVSWIVETDNVIQLKQALDRIIWELSNE